MRKTLEVRLVIAEEERRMAEQEILEKEASAQSAVAEQELIMEKVVQESKLLQQEAEENAKVDIILSLFTCNDNKILMKMEVGVRKGNVRVFFWGGGEGGGGLGFLHF